MIDEEGFNEFEILKMELLIIPNYGRMTPAFLLILAYSED